MSWLLQSKPLVILAPMDGYTDPPFRRFVKTVEPRVVVFSEFLSAMLVRRKPSLARSLFKIHSDERPVVIQLYGKDCEDFSFAAKLAEDQGAAGIDINMGCPAKKVVAHRHGSALMKNIELACEIIATVKRAVKVPVTVKTRLGWEDEQQLIPFAQQLQNEGLDAITIHGRTYLQKFDGVARWSPIYALKQDLDIPVIGNGDINSASMAQAKLGNLDGVMVGRAAVSNPWLMRQICDVFAGTSPIADTVFTARIPAWKRFAEMTVEARGELNACRVLRKYLVRLVRDQGFGLEMRKRVTSVESLKQVFQALDKLGDTFAR